MSSHPLTFLRWLFIVVVVVGVVAAVVVVIVAFPAIVVSIFGISTYIPI